MAKKVLIFESDGRFAAEVQHALETAHCEVRIAADADAGFDAAQKLCPDLILLSAELPKVNGLSVCNKLKRDDTLKTVPVIVLSAAATEETFRQHGMLRTRADAYVKKPIGMPALLRQVNALLPLGLPPEALAVGTRTGGDDASESTDVVFSEPPEGGTVLAGAPESRRSEQPPKALEISESDFEAPTRSRSVRPKESDPPEDDIEIEEHLAEVIDLEDDDDLVISGAPPPVEAPAPESTEALVGGSLTRISSRPPPGPSEDEKKREELLLAKDQEIKRLKREIERAKAAPAPTGGSGQAREFLDLRERLNKKDKELLEQREQVTMRDKELLALRDNALELERQLTDVGERAAELERERGELQKELSIAKEDKEQAAKRSDDYKRMTEKLKAELELRAGEVVSAKEAGARELAAALQKAQSAADEAVDRALGNARRAHERELAEALTSAKQASDAAHADALTLLKREAEEDLTALRRAHDAALATAHAEHEAASDARVEEALRAQAAEFQARLDKESAEQRFKLEAQSERHAAELGELRQELEARVRAGTALDEELRALKARHDEQRERMKELLGGALAELDRGEETASK